MFLLDWYKQWLSIRAEHKERMLLVSADETVCKSCETLKTQLEISNYEKKQLMDTVMRMNTPPGNPVPERVMPPEILRPRTIPWNVRRQMLEAEDRKEAQLLKEATRQAELAKAAATPKVASDGAATVIPDTSQSDSIAALEKELGVEEAPAEQGAS